MPEETVSPQEVLAHYVSGPDQLEAALAGLSESDLDLSIVPGEWTIRQIVHHLVDGDGVWSLCAKVALGASGATFDFRWHPGNESWANALDYSGLAVGLAVALFRAQRLHLAQLLDHIPDAWQRCVILAAPWSQQEQQMRVDAVVGLLTAHVTEHVGEIQKIRAQHGLG